MQNMNYYYDFSGQKFGYPLSLSMNCFYRSVFSRQNSLEISYVLQGTYEVSTSQFSAITKEKDIIVIAPDDIHRLCPTDENGVILTIHIDFSRMNESLAGNYENRFYTDIYTEDRDQKTYLKLCRTIGELVQELMEDSLNLYHMNMIMMEFLYITSSAQPFKLPLHTDYYENYIKAVKYIDEHYSEDITLSQIAQKLAFSNSYTSKLMKKYMGIPFIKYLAYVRVRASLENLLEGKETIEQIALECGMPSSKAYAMTFKELYGISPSTYRKQFKNNMKFTKTSEKQEMILDVQQKKLLQHLITESRCIYEDNSLKIMKENNAIQLQMDTSNMQIQTTSEGKTIVKIQLL